MTRNPRLNDPTSPLVSILIFNYNYGRYLRECFDSALTQTYDNIEINFSDNASTDDSWDIALEYQRRYPDVFFVARNRTNFGTDANFRNVLGNAHGKYFIELCSDDVLLPDYIATCVHLLESHLDAGFAMVHRSILDDRGQRIEEPPFYDQTCKIPGAAQTTVYMMASINPAVSQIVYRMSATLGKTPVDGLITRWYGTRIMDFNICCDYPIIYIKEPLMLHRLHGDNDSLRAADILMEVIGPYVLNHQFAGKAAVLGHLATAERLPASIEKVARLGLRYATRALLEGNERNAQRYFHLAMAIWPEIVNDANHQTLSSYWMASEKEKPQHLDTLRTSNYLVVRTISYQPPPGSTPISI